MGRGITTERLRVCAAERMVWLYKLHGHSVLLRVFDRRDGCMRVCSRLSSKSPRLEEQMFGGQSSAGMRSSTDRVPIIWRTSQDRVRYSIIVDSEVLRLSLADHMRLVGHCGEPCRDRISVSNLSQSARISTALVGSVAIVRSEEG